jgi:plastocyanin
VLLAGLSTGHKIGLAVVALVFIGFALTSSFVAPRRRPDFPGKNGLSVFVIACFFLFAAMLSAVILFGVESESGKTAEAATSSGATVQVQEKEYKITVATQKVHPGVVTLVVKNVGKIPHNLSVQSGKHTASIGPGKTAKLTVTLKKGSYTLYCSVPGHRQLGMVTKLSVT